VIVRFAFSLGALLWKRREEELNGLQDVRLRLVQVNARIRGYRLENWSHAENRGNEALSKLR
jgi:hypothetical protein